MFNHTQFAAPPRKRSLASQLLSGGFAALSLVVLLFASQAQAQAPVVGTPISNQASASYKDVDGKDKTTVSNVVTTTVTQVAALDLTADGTKTVIAGATAYLPHTLTNLGNGADSFILALAGATSPKFTSFQLFLDADGNGVPDSSTALCTGTGTGAGACGAFATPSLEPNGTYKFIVALQVPMTATASNTTAFDTATIKATSVLSATLFKTNTDTVYVDTVGFEVTKSIDKTNGSASLASCDGTNYSGAGCIKAKYTLTYTNTGAQGHLYLKDIIGVAGSSTEGMEYIADSAKWSDAAAALGDTTAADDPAGINYVYDSSTKTLQAVIANVPRNRQGYISFEVGIKSTAKLGIVSTTNAAKFGIATTTSVTTGTPTVQSDTNKSSYAVTLTARVIANNGANTANVPDDGNNNDVAGNDLVSVASATPGTTVEFLDYVWNTGASTDTFDITYSNVNFPANTVFQLYKSDGVTPLMDSNGGGVPDTGPVNAGDKYIVYVKAIIPADVCTPSCPSGPFDVKVVATSITDSSPPNGTNAVFDRLLAITLPSVDLTNSAAGTAGDTTHGTDIGTYTSSTIPTTPTTTLTVDPGASALFNLYVKSASSGGDNYNLQFSATNFVAGTLPTTPAAGWSVEFHKGVCPSSGAVTGEVVTNTGDINSADGAVPFCAVVATPAGAAATSSPVNIYFKVISQATGASDMKLDAVTIRSNPLVALTPQGNGQVYPGGSIVYPHVLTNVGNTTCNGSFTFVLSNVSTGWQANLYNDADGDGVIDTGETLLYSSITAGSTPLSGALTTITATTPNPSHKLLMQVISPAGASSGETDNITIKVQDNSSSNSCTATGPGGFVITNDATVVIGGGQLRLEKLQAIDADCDGTTTTDPTPDTATHDVKPGQCIYYQVNASNEGTSDVTDVKINDNVPAHTTYKTGGGVAALTCSTGAFTAPANGGTGVVSCDALGTVTPGKKVTMSFTVKVDPI